jgi:hypothetical protein
MEHTSLIPGLAGFKPRPKPNAQGESFEREKPIVRLLKNLAGVSERTRTRSRWRGRDIDVAFSAAALIATALLSTAAAGDSIVWKRNGAPITASIKKEPWTLEQSGAANGLKSSGYCDGSGNPVGNPGTERMEPDYFPFVLGEGNKLQGYFDWRPKDTDEGVVAASSTGGA